ncbi:hypothetical protein OG777_19845 [Micromonospora peucetia]|uniref:Uncharacterized protein n=1 Tax=Micromonospora peucetia TaxID=47871 RepID=A0ABZ1EM79_9ACTN|nr:hypothetical protein [Micromonospora peucetia]MCX4389164.1 hypothetical protein [Micromonospora peucetia]WSA35359.1 hypothetical protein OIE14_15595 [Micromonospora peucetia]
MEAVEIYRPLDQVTRVVYDGISIFGDRADAVEFELARRLRLEVINDGSTVVAPDAFLAFGKSLSESGYFDSVVVAAPGYYDDIALPPEPEFPATPPRESQLEGQEGLF